MMRTYHLVDDRQAQPTAALVARTGVIQPDESLEHPAPLGLWDPGTVIVDRQYHFPAALGERDVDPARRVPRGIVTEVAQDAPQRVGVSNNGDRAHG